MGDLGSFFQSSVQGSDDGLSKSVGDVPFIDDPKVEDSDGSLISRRGLVRGGFIAGVGVFMGTVLSSLKIVEASDVDDYLAMRGELGFTSGGIPKPPKRKPGFNKYGFKHGGGGQHFSSRGGYRSRVGQKLEDLAGSLSKIVTVPIKEIREIPGDIIDGYRHRNALTGTASAVGSIIRGSLEAANGVVRQTTYTAMNSSEVVVSALALTNNSTPRLDKAFYWGESFVGGTLDNTWGGDEFHLALRRLYQNIAPGGDKYNPKLFLLEHREGKKVAAIAYHDGVRLASLFLPYALAEYVFAASDREAAIGEIVRRGPFKPGGR